MTDALNEIWAKVDQMLGSQRMETEMEHIARDIRDGRFPLRSDAIQVPVNHDAPPMTDLTQALVELRRVTPPNSPWEAGDIGVGSSPVDYHIATILNAALSGTMIPRADADLAVALMVAPLLKLREGIEADIRSAHHGRGNGSSSAMREDDRDFRAAVAAAFDALAPDAGTAALAELQVLRDERDRLDAVTNTLSEMWEGEQTARHSAEAELATLRAQVERLTAKLALVQRALEKADEGLEYMGLYAPALTEGAAP